MRIAGVLLGVTSLLFPALPWAPFFELFDAPLPALAIPGFVGGVLFALVLGIAARRRRFDELSLPRFAAWGAVGGVLLGLVPALLVAVGGATLREGLGVWQLALAIGAPLTLLSAAAAHPPGRYGSRPPSRATAARTRAPNAGATERLKLAVRWLSSVKTTTPFRTTGQRADAGGQITSFMSTSATGSPRAAAVCASVATRESDVARA